MGDLGFNLLDSRVIVTMTGLYKVLPPKRACLKSDIFVYFILHICVITKINLFNELSNS